MKEEVSIIRKQASVEEIFKYLTLNSNVFIPELKSRIDIREFSRKISVYGTHFWAYHNDKPVGFMACYLNDPGNELGYISTISVTKDWQRLGIGSRLLDAGVQYASEREFRRVALEVRNCNSAAAYFYMSRGFRLVRQDHNSAFYEINTGD